MDTMTDAYKTKKFPLSYGTLEVSLNHSRRVNDADAIYIGIEQAGEDLFSSLSRSDATALRDHLNDLLDEPVVESPTANDALHASDRASSAMEELAFRLALLDTDDLVDALNRHAEALEGFNK